MFSFLKNHPFAVEATFDSSLVVTFALTKEQLSPLIPTCLALDTFLDKWAFAAVAMVRTKSLRPKGFSKIFGNDFFLIGYRIFVRYKNKDGKQLRGLYILSSQTDSKKMEFLGNIFTQYNYATIDITQIETGHNTTIRSAKAAFEITIDDSNEDILLPDASPFPDWKEARKFAGPLPFTFSYNEKKKQVLIVEGVRQHWIPQPVKVLHHQFSFLQAPAFENATLANAFIIKNIPYYWKKGKIEEWSR